MIAVCTKSGAGSAGRAYMMVTYASIMAGQMIVAAGDVRSDALFMVTGILFCLALLPTAGCLAGPATGYE